MASPRTVLRNQAPRTPPKKEREKRDRFSSSLFSRFLRFFLSSSSPSLSLSLAASFVSTFAMVAASSCYASPFYTWFLAACMSVAHSSGGDNTRQAVGRRSRRRQLSNCSAVSCLDFRSCNHYNNNNNIALSSSLFGSSTVPLYRNQRRLNRGTTSSGNNIFLCFLRLKFLFFFYVSLHKS